MGTGWELDLLFFYIETCRDASHFFLKKYLPFLLTYGQGLRQRWSVNGKTDDASPLSFPAAAAAAAAAWSSDLWGLSPLFLTAAEHATKSPPPSRSKAKFATVLNSWYSELRTFFYLQGEPKRYGKQKKTNFWIYLLLNWTVLLILNYFDRSTRVRCSSRR